MKILDSIKSKSGLFMIQWFGVSNPWGNSAFETVGGTVQKATYVINFAIAFGAFMAVAYLVFGGIMMITSGGDSDKFESGSNAVTNSIIGLVIIFLAGTIVRFLVGELLS